MRRAVNWFVFCLSLAFLFANLTFGRRTVPALDLAVTPQPVPGYSKVFVEERGALQFGYVREDGSFEPLPEQPASATDADEQAVWSSWPETASAASQVTSASPSWQ